MYRLEVKLKQHTPLIHFQWEEEGATLRPTELKAKLDRWIIASGLGCHGMQEERLQKINDKASDEKYRRWKKNCDFPAFDYKVSVRACGENGMQDSINPEIEEVRGKEKIKDDSFPCFFGNQMPISDFKKGVKNTKRFSYFPLVMVCFESVHEDLIEEIRKELPVFLLHTNFGTRQSKGYGSFYVDVDDPAFPPENGGLGLDVLTGSFYYFDVELDTAKKVEEPKLQENLFGTIDLFYKSLRGGINPNDTHRMYFKPMIWKYARSMGCQWEKKTIKQTYFSSDEEYQKQQHHEDNDTPLFWEEGRKQKIHDPTKEQNVETHLLWRDVLGLSCEQKWGGNKICKKNKEYSRLQSPIFFKPLRCGEKAFRVFFEVPAHLREAFRNGERAPESEILGTWFDVNKNGFGTLRLPMPPTFDFDEFFKEAFSTDLEKWVRDGDKTRNPSYKKLKAIYDQLKAQKKE